MPTDALARPVGGQAPWRSGPPSRRARAAAAVAACLLLPALTACYQPPEAAFGPGDGSAYVDGGEPGDPEFVGFPLASFPPNGSQTVKAVGTEFASGSLVVFNRGDEDLRIVSVEPDLGGGGLRYLGAQTAGEQRTIGYAQLVDGWPAKDKPELGPLREASGTVVPAGEFGAERGVEVLIGLRVAREGRSTVKGVTVRYADRSGEEYEETFVSTLAVCTPPVPAEDCRPEYAGT